MLNFQAGVFSRDHFEFKSGLTAFDGVDGECKDSAADADMQLSYAKFPGVDGESAKISAYLRIEGIPGESQEPLWETHGVTFEDPLFG